MKKPLALALSLSIFMTGLPAFSQEEEDRLEEVPAAITSLFEAVRADDLQKLRAGVGSGADLMHPACAGLLHTAVEFDNAEALRFLLKSGAQANARPAAHDGMTALHMAVKKGGGDLVAILLEGGALPNIHADENYTEGLTPLQYAVKSDDPRLVKLLLDKGADINMTSFEGKSPLLIAVAEGRYRMAELLLVRKAHVNAGESSGFTPLHSAVSRAGDECGAEKIDPNNFEGCATCMVKLLLRYGADINARGSDGDSPLHQAIMGNCLPLVIQLVETGADVNARNDRGKSPLYVAHEHARTDIVDYLRSCGKRLDSDPELARYQRGRRMREWERKQEELIERGLYLGIPIAYAGASIYLREFHYRYAPQNNPLAPVHGLASAVVLSGLGGGLIGLLLGLPTGRDGTIISMGLLGAALGIVGGIYIGARYFDGIERSRVLYYSGTSLVLLVPLFYLNF